jgi:hypothetical protein
MATSTAAGEHTPMKTWQDRFTGPKLAGWEQLDMVLPDVMPYYPRRPVNKAEWKAKGGALEVGSQANAWSYLLRGEPTDTDYTLEFDVMMPFFTPDRVEYFGQYFASHRTGEFEPCWEAGAVVRYTDRSHFYRVQFGWLAGGNAESVGGCVALWSPDGGFLQVVPWGAKPFKYEHVKVAASGDTIEVWVGDELKIHYQDTVAPIRKGRCGLAAAGVQFYRFKDVRCTRNRELRPGSKAVRPGEGKKKFHVRHFLRQQFLFCNNEPIGRFDRDTSM